MSNETEIREEPLWAITLCSPSPGLLGKPDQLLKRATTCTNQAGALVFKGGASGTTVKAIIAPGQWLMVEREDNRE